MADAGMADAGGGGPPPPDAGDGGATGGQRILWGAVGGALPVLVAMFTVDLAPIIDNPAGLTVGNYVGYVIRIAGLVLGGGLVAYLNRSVSDRLVLLQIGVAAPALIAGIINTAGQGPPRHAGLELSLIGAAVAAETSAAMPVQVAAGFLQDVTKGLVMPLGKIQAPVQLALPPDTNPDARPASVRNLANGTCIDLGADSDLSKERLQAIFPAPDYVIQTVPCAPL